MARELRRFCVTLDNNQMYHRHVYGRNAAHAASVAAHVEGSGLESFTRVWSYPLEEAGCRFHTLSSEEQIQEMS